jgi:hypothetical protein
MGWCRIPVVLAVLLPLGAGCSGSAWPTGPTADFSISELCDLVPAVAVTGDISTVGDSPIVSYEWDFGDGSWAFGLAHEHRYAQSGAKQITLTVTDANGLGDAVMKGLTPTTCLSVTSESVTVDATTATPTAQVSNGSTLDGALVAFTLDVIGTNGLPLAQDLDAGQHQIPMGNSVTLSPVGGPIDCGSICSSFAAATVRVRVTSTYWCGAAC